MWGLTPDGIAESAAALFGGVTALFGAVIAYFAINRQIRSAHADVENQLGAQRRAVEEAHVQEVAAYRNAVSVALEHIATAAENVLRSCEKADGSRRSTVLVAPQLRIEAPSFFDGEWRIAASFGPKVQAELIALAHQLRTYNDVASLPREAIPVSDLLVPLNVVRDRALGLLDLLREK